MAPESDIGVVLPPGARVGYTPSMKTLCSLAPLVVLLSCGAEPEKKGKTDAGLCGSVEPTRYLIAREIGFERETDGVSAGFDIDGAVTATGDPTGCGRADYVSPDGVGGIDNAIAGLMPFLDTTEAVGLEDIIQGAINDGRLLLLLELEGVDDWQQDDCVAVRLVFGAGMPARGSDGRLLVDQTMYLSETVAMAEPVEGRIESGVLTAEGLNFDLPIDIFSAQMVLSIGEASVRVALDEETGTAEGVLGGGFPYANLLDGLLNAAIDSTLKDALPVLIPSLADLAPDETGVCQNISVALGLGMAEVYVYDEPAPEEPETTLETTETSETP